MNDEKEARMECPKPPEGGLRHEYIFCHCDMEVHGKAMFEKGREELKDKVENAKLLEAKYWVRRYTDKDDEVTRLI